MVMINGIVKTINSSQLVLISSNGDDTTINTPAPPVSPIVDEGDTCLGHY